MSLSDIVSVQVEQWACNGGANQVWTFNAPDQTLRSNQSGMCLTAVDLNTQVRTPLVHACDHFPVIVRDTDPPAPPPPHIVHQRVGSCADGRVGIVTAQQRPQRNQHHL